VSRALLISRSYFPPQVGGISTMMAELCRHLGPDRISVMTGVDGWRDAGAIGNVCVHRMGTDPIRSAGRAVCLALKLAHVAVTERPQVVLLATLEDAYEGYLTTKLLRLPQIIFAHGNEILHALRPGWSRPREILQAAARVIAVSGYTRDLVLRAGVPSERVTVIHPGCDMTRIHQVPVPDEELGRLTRGRPRARRLLTVGNLVERKGHDVVIRAIAALGPRANDLVYLVAGDGPHAAVLQRLSEELGVADRVAFLGRVGESDLRLLYSMADAFVMVSRERSDQCDVEGFGIVYIEAAACGLPVIAGRSGGVSDAVVDGITGLLVQPDSPHAVAEAIDRLLTTPGMASAMGHAARARAIAGFRWEQFAGRIDAEISALATRR
jgi:phosphatidylinositol alpha-1,6-mannosyltransferase